MLRSRLPDLVAASVLAFVACTSTESDEVTREKCERLRDHVIDVQLARLPSSVAPPSVVTPPDPDRNEEPKHVVLPSVQPDVAGHRAALTQALGDAYVASCQKNLNAAQLKCSLAAADSGSITECQTSLPK